METVGVEPTPPRCKRGALPIELHPRGADGWTRMPLRAEVHAVQLAELSCAQRPRGRCRLRRRRLNLRRNLPGWSRTSDLRRPKPAGCNLPYRQSSFVSTPAGFEPAASGLRVRRHSCSTKGAWPKTNIPWERSPPMPALPASATHGRNRNDFTDRSHHGSAKPSGTSIGYSDGRDRTCASRLTVACLTARPHRNMRRKERESNPQGRGPPVFETGYHARWQSFQQVTPAGLEPARPRLRVGRSTELSYGARDVVGRARTCNAPRFRRALYLH